MLKLEHITWDLPDGEGILKGIDLTVPSGKLVVITGPNGGGKTTLAKIIAGLETPTEGRIFFEGEDITGLDITERARKGISYAFQQPVQFKGLRVRDLMTLASGKKAKFTDACDVLSEVGLCARDYMDMGIPSWTLPTYTSCP